LAFGETDKRMETKSAAEKPDVQLAAVSIHDGIARTRGFLHIFGMRTLNSMVSSICWSLLKQLSGLSVS
jgi:hypothetical protein